MIATQTWGQRYSDEVERMTLYYEAVNRCSETKTHKATPEETAYFESLIELANKRNNILKRSDLIE